MRTPDVDEGRRKAEGEQDAEAPRQRVEQDGEHRRDQQRRDKPDQAADDLARRGASSRVRSSQRYGSTLRSGAASASEAAPAAPAASSAAPAMVVFWVSTSGGAGEDEDAVEHAEDEPDAGPDDPREISRPTDRSIGMRVHLGD